MEAERSTKAGEATFDLDESPFAAPPVEGIPFPKDGDEARAIERVLREAEEDRRSRLPSGE